MAHIARTVKNVEAPRPLKSSARSSMKNNFMLIEELIQLIENVAISLQSGISNTEPMATLVQNLRIHGPQLESISKDTLDRAFVVFRNASQDERLNIMTRLNLLELIELRAKSWEDNGSNSYYKTKQANNNLELSDLHHVDPTQSAAFLSTSPTTFGGAAAAAGAAAAIAAVGSAQQQQLLLGPGEVIRNSGKFPKPTKIPGKTYCKDEVVIRNADSGKVMGIKGRRVHMIEELSETIISFQRVNPGAKERLVQITGPNEEKINYAKQLIEDTIRRNASPVRLEPASSGGGVAGGGSCSSLASSNSDEVQPRVSTGTGAGNNANISNRLSFNSAQNFITASAAAQQIAAQQQQHLNAMPSSLNTITTGSGGVKVLRPNQQMLLHSFSTSDASVGEYSFSVNVGHSVVKITGDCFELVRMAKLVLDDYFSSAEFLASVEAGAAFDGSIGSTPTTPLGPPQFITGGNTCSTPLQAAADSGIGLNFMASHIANASHDGDDDVFAEQNGLNKSASQANGLSRSRRSHFSRKESPSDNATTINATTAAGAAASSATAGAGGNIAVKRVNSTKNILANNQTTSKIQYSFETLLLQTKNPQCWTLPKEWRKITEKHSSIVRNKVPPNENDCFDGEKYLDLLNSIIKRNITAAATDDANNPDGNNETNQDNE